jgi:hypothetical protein
MTSVDEEWNKYVSNQYCNDMPETSYPKSINIDSESMVHSSKPGIYLSTPSKICKQVDDCFHDEDNDGVNSSIIDEESDDFISSMEKPTAPVCEDLYISTQTKVVFLNREIDIHNIFWKIPIIEYWKPIEGVVKKQMKIVSKTPEEFHEYQKKLEGIYYFTENIIRQINNPTARRIKFKDERKITIGISKKDIMNCRGKIKNAFYNCFAVILRFRFEGVFREIHVKVFNTGKMEIPGVVNNQLLEIIKEMVLNIINPHLEEPVSFVENTKDENVLINSNFKCGFFINREKFHSILNRKYGIETSFDPCSYPGVKCKFYFNNDLPFDKTVQNGKIIEEDRSLKMSELGENKKYTEVSFMIFRTGSCLIVGNCSEKILLFIFHFIKQILADEYSAISVMNEEVVAKTKKSKIRKKTVSMTQNYFDIASA